MKFNRKGLTDEQLIELYKAILKPRMIGRENVDFTPSRKISKWFSGIGQAISVGLHLMEHEEYILPMHRNLGVFTTKRHSVK